MSVGDAAIDRDHMAFFELVGILNDAQRRKSVGQVVESALLMLEEYICGHFHREEKVMRKLGHPRLAVHTRAHDYFRARVQAITYTYRTGTPSAADGLPQMVAEWLKAHILSEDMLLRQWIGVGVIDDRPLVYLAMDAEELSRDGRKNIIQF